MEEHTYICIDLKSFFASVECVERGLDPMNTRLVVADPQRGDKTICLAVTPAMKALGVKNRCRIFEIDKGIDYIVAEPRMKKYMEYSREIYKIYLRFFSKDDIHVYSIDEVFIDATEYMQIYGLDAKALALRVMDRILADRGIRSTAGIGSNLYLAKIALDIMAKRSKDFIGVLDEQSYKELLWEHRPLTDFWRVGRGTAKKLEGYGIYTMRQVAEADEDFLYEEFGVDAELLIDHAKGIEPTTMADIKGYRNKSNSLSSGQVLMRDYSFAEARLIVKEMAEAMCLNMTKKGVETRSLTLQLGYSNRLKATPAHGSVLLEDYSNLPERILPKIEELYDRIADGDMDIRRIYLNCNNIRRAEKGERQMSLFERAEGEEQKEESRAEKGGGKEMQEALLRIQQKYGKNAIFKAMDLEEAATARERNEQTGGHKNGK